LTTEVPHETQEGCIAALHSEIGRMRGILSTLKPAGSARLPEREEEPAAPMRLGLGQPSDAFSRER
jgi:hypothetical protein